MSWRSGEGERPSRCLAIPPVLWDPAPVRRVVVIVYLALLTFNVSGLAAICGETVCDESCPTDISGGQCAPNCHYCNCCSLPRVAGSATVTLVAPQPLSASWISPNDDLTSPEPADILHVPKSLA